MQLRNFFLAIFATALMGAGTQLARAGAMNVYGNGQMVPYATYTSGGPTTAVGILANTQGTVYWSFHDGNGNRRHSGSFSIAADNLYPFIWSSEAAGAATNLSGTVGYLVFAIDTNGDGKIDVGDTTAAISSNAFYVDLSASDVAYIPTIYLSHGSLANPSPSTWTNNPVLGLSVVWDGAAYTGLDVDVQYLIDGASGGDDTSIYIWSASAPPSSSPATIHDGSGASKAITLTLLNDNLNVLDLEDNPDVTSSFNGDGYVRWTVPTLATSPFVFLFSIVESPAFGAAQTLMGHSRY